MFDLGGWKKRKLTAMQAFANIGITKPTIPDFTHFAEHFYCRFKFSCFIKNLYRQQHLFFKKCKNTPDIAKTCFMHWLVRLFSGCLGNCTLGSNRCASARNFGIKVVLRPLTATFHAFYQSNVFVFYIKALPGEPV
ncbi:hypothetical protein C7N43_14690 [Sphingobacteriales bacterium UPWRP_1]|nr:hypothetical protein BVG80_05070 [Sphingobacteriales bacterium TSM_CSM]PSJ76243.1 hypothetical protein C7N43_14690 [Sphingobacteriales bacterium UPWRP_1]